MKMQLKLTDEQGNVLDELDFEIGGEDGYDLSRSMARAVLSADVLEMIERAMARSKKV